MWLVSDGNLDSEGCVWKVLFFCFVFYAKMIKSSLQCLLTKNIKNEWSQTKKIIVHLFSKKKIHANKYLKYLKLKVVIEENSNMNQEKQTQFQQEIFKVHTTWKSRKSKLWSLKKKEKKEVGLKPPGHFIIIIIPLFQSPGLTLSVISVLSSVLFYSFSLYSTVRVLTFYFFFFYFFFFYFVLFFVPMWPTYYLVQISWTAVQLKCLRVSSSDLQTLVQFLFLLLSRRSWTIWFHRNWAEGRSDDPSGATAAERLETPRTSCPMWFFL